MTGVNARRRRFLVVDASVAHSAGTTEHPQSRCCRDVLDAMLTICHRVVLTDALLEEWNRHASPYAWQWMGKMYARHGKHRRLSARLAATVTGAFKKANLSPEDKEIIEKDRCLVEAALASDKVIVTRDDRILQAMMRYPRLARIARQIRWINPVRDGVEVLERL